MKYDVYEYSNQGGRDYNEDAIGHSIKDGNGVFVVADGLGGHKFGELASSIVVDTLVNGFTGDFKNNTSKWLEEQIELSNQRILEEQKIKAAILKSTVVALAVNNNKAVWANVGDSRLYFLRDRELIAFTNDHSVAFKKYKAGEITREQIKTDEDQSCLLRTLGSEDRKEPELYDYNVNIKENDAFMLCSDGVWEYISDEEVMIDLLKSENSKEWAENLLVRLMDRIDGSNDNLTIMTIMVSE